MNDYYNNNNNNISHDSMDSIMCVALHSLHLAVGLSPPMQFHQKNKKKIKKIKNQIEKLPFFGFYNKLNIKNPPKRRLNFMSPFLLITSPLHLL